MHQSVVSDLPLTKPYVVEMKKFFQNCLLLKSRVLFNVESLQLTPQLEPRSLPACAGAGAQHVNFFQLEFRSRLF